MFVARNHPLRRGMALVLAVLCGAALASGARTGLAATLYVDGRSTNPIQTGSAVFPFHTVGQAYTAATPGDVLVIRSGEYRESLVMTKNLQLTASPGIVTIGHGHWGRLANPGFENHAIRTTLFFAGMELDGSGNVNPGDPYYNVCGPSAVATSCYSRHSLDARDSLWIDPANPSSGANRDYVVGSIASAGFNVLSMSSWGESTLPCTIPCPDPVECAKEPRCKQDPFGKWTCRIGWFGAANMQISWIAQNQLFDATLGKPVLVMPFIESRFGLDWDFHDDFPTDANNRVAPGLVTQIEDLLDRYVLHPANPAWPAKWARVFDSNGQARYAVTIIQASSARLPATDPASDAAFAAGFDAVAQQILADRGVLVGFFIDPIPRDPAPGIGCLSPADEGRVKSNYGPVGPGAWFKPDPGLTGPWLRLQNSLLGIQCYSPEGWLDTFEDTTFHVDSCYKVEWKEQFSRAWHDTGIPFLQDVTPGYDGSKLFADRPYGLKKWGYDPNWRTRLAAMVDRYGEAGLAWNSWNGYCEGLFGMPTKEESPGFASVTWMKSLTAKYP